jgi:hypothetical protein
MRIEGEREVLDYLNRLWGEGWEICPGEGDWVADRRYKLDETEIRAGLEMSLVAEDLQTLSRLINRQSKLEAKLMGTRL